MEKISKIWHKPTEKPHIPSRIVTVYGCIVDSWDYVGTKHSNDMLLCCHRWAYFKDLIKFDV